MNKFIRTALAPVAAALMMVAGTSSAAVLTSNMSVDNGYRIYVSTADNVQGTLFGSANNWYATYTDTTVLAAGQSYFLHIYAYDQGGIAGLLGEFALTGGGHQFANGQTSMTTNTTNWMGNNAGFGSTYGAVVGLGNDGVSPWGFRPGIADSATWIWAGDANNNDHAYFTTRISAVPEPTTVAMFGLGLLALGAAGRRSKQGSKQA